MKKFTLIVRKVDYIWKTKKRKTPLSIHQIQCIHESLFHYIYQLAEIYNNVVRKKHLKNLIYSRKGETVIHLTRSKTKYANGAWNKTNL
jgi:phage protein D